MINKILLFSGILSCVKDFFLLWPTSIPIRFPVKFYFSTVLFIFVYSSWYSGLFCILYIYHLYIFYIYILYLFYRILIFLYFLAGIPGLPRLVWELTFSESDTTRILNILSANFAPPFQFHFSFFSFSLSTFHKVDPIQFYGNITTLIFGNNFGHGKSWANMIQLLYCNSWDHRVELCLFGPKRK